MSRKHQVLQDLYNYCLAQGNMVFHNDTVKDFSRKNKFSNPFDATKLDSTNKLPRFMIDNDLCILHLGKGYHRFLKGIHILYHRFEPVQQELTWEYRKSLLNEYNDSESNILSVANNQRILHDFLFGQDLEFDNLPVSKRPKTYFPHRTKATLEYSFGDEHIVCEKQQIEIDLTIEYDGTICVFEAKNGTPTDFNIYQLYNPFLYYHSAFPQNKILCVYLVRNGDSLKLWLYTFADPLQLGSIQFIKSCGYNLKRS